VTRRGPCRFVGERIVRAVDAAAVTRVFASTAVLAAVATITTW